MNENLYKPSVSVIIRNKNEAQYLETCLFALRNQIYPDIEIILVDNESDDNSRDIAQKYNCKILTIKKGEFTYGKGLNVGISASTGEIIFVFSAHSVVIGRFFVQEAVMPFQDPAIAASRLFTSGKASDWKRLMNPQVLVAGGDFISNGPLASGCVIRKKVWEDIPFDEKLRAAEEKDWAFKALEAGYHIDTGSAATYVYIKKIPPHVQIKKNYKELITVKERFGMLVGFVNRSIGQAFIAMLKEITVGALKSVVEIYRTSFSRFYLTLKTRLKYK